MSFWFAVWFLGGVKKGVFWGRGKGEMIEGKNVKKLRDSRVGGGCSGQDRREGT